MTNQEFVNLMTEIKADVFGRVSADAMNALHGATPGHPWAKGKTLAEMALEARFALAGRKCHATLMHKLERVA